MTTIYLTVLLAACAACAGVAYLLCKRRFAKTLASVTSAHQAATTQNLNEIHALEDLLFDRTKESQLLQDKFAESFIGKLKLAQKSVSRRQQNQFIAKELNAYLVDNGFAEMVNPKLHLVDDLGCELVKMAELLQQAFSKRAPCLLTYSALFMKVGK
jgi:hypothetical protein